MFGSLTLRQVGVFLVASLLIVAGVIAIGLRDIGADVHRIDRTWRTFQVELSERARLEGALRSILGYGGLIHHFKNYILRGSPALHAQVNKDIGAALAVVKRYRDVDLTPGESAALDDVESAILAYAAKAAYVPQLKAQGMSITGIDTLAKVDDSAALRGLETLRASVFAEGTEGVESKAVLIAELNSVLGYGGMIHAFKNLVLRKSDAYMAKAEMDMATARAILDRLRGLASTPGEGIALDDIAAMIDAYGKRLVEVQQAHQLAIAIEEIDDAVRMDDGPALRGLTLLNQAVAYDIRERAEYTSGTIAQVERDAAWVMWVAAGGVLTMALVLGVILYGRVLTPIQRMGKAMTDLAEGDVTVDIQHREDRNEIGDMARALAIFRKSMIRQMELGQALESSNEELNAQLAELRMLKERGEEQTAQAIGLAENLAVARDAADRATSRAEGDEKRIRAILEAVNDAILTIDAQGRIETFNPAAQVIFGYRADDIVGSHIDILLPPGLGPDGALIARYIEGDRLNAFEGGRREFQGMRRGGLPFPVELAMSTIRVGDRESFTLVISDITKRKEAEAEIRRLALTDPLTELANRNQFMRRFVDALSLGRRQPHWQVTLMMVDLDRFKPVNDTHGHPTGDALLKHVADTLKSIARDSDTVARLGGDEFALILVDSGDRNAVARKAEAIVTALRQPVEVLGHRVTIGASVGIASYPYDGDDIDVLMARADQALYAAKEAGRNTWRFHGDGVLVEAK